MDEILFYFPFTWVFYALWLKLIMIKFWIKCKKNIHFKSQFGGFCLYLFYSLWYYTYKLHFMFQNLIHILTQLSEMEVEEDTLNSIMTPCWRYFYLDKVVCPWKEIASFQFGPGIGETEGHLRGFASRLSRKVKEFLLEYSHYGLWSTCYKLG